MKFFAIILILSQIQNRLLRQDVQERYPESIGVEGKKTTEEVLFQNQEHSELKETLQKALEDNHYGPVALSPEVVKQLTEHLKGLIGNKAYQDPTNTYEDQFENEIVKYNHRLEQIEQLIEKGKNKTNEALELKKEIKKLKEKLHAALLHFHRGDLGIIEKYEEEIKSLQDKLNGVSNIDEETLTKEMQREKIMQQINQAITMIEKRLSDLLHELEQMLDDGENKIMITEKRTIIELYQKLYKTYLEQKLRVHEIEKIQREKLLAEKQIVDLENLKKNQPKEVIEKIDEKIDELYLKEEDLATKEKVQEELEQIQEDKQQDLDSIINQVENFEVLSSDDAEKAEDLQDLENQEEELKYTYSDKLNFQLDTESNPMVQHLNKVISKDFNGAKQIQEKLETQETLSSYKDIQTISELLNKSLTTLTLMAEKFYQDKNNIPKEIVDDEQSQVVLRKTRNYLQVYHQKNQIFKERIQTLIKFIDLFDATSTDWKNFFDVKQIFTVASNKSSDADTYANEYIKQIEGLSQENIEIYQKFIYYLNTLENDMTALLLNSKQMMEIFDKTLILGEEEFSLTDEQQNYLLINLPILYDQMEVVSVDIQNCQNKIQELQKQRDKYDNLIMKLDSQADDFKKNRSYAVILSVSLLLMFQIIQSQKIQNQVLFSLHHNSQNQVHFFKHFVQVIQ